LPVNQGIVRQTEKSSQAKELGNFGRINGKHRHLHNYLLHLDGNAFLSWAGTSSATSALSPGFLITAAREAIMKLVLVTVLTAIILVIPVIGGVHLAEKSPVSSRVTVIHKNQASPTIEDLGQKAGDPSNAGAPDNEPLFDSKRKAQWI
jgi:hypothetical protein